MLAIVAGEGHLPGALISRLAETPVVGALQGFLPDDVQVDLTFRLETLGSFLVALKDRGVTEVCFAGGIRRPVIDPTAIDAATMPLVPVMQKALGAGDDSALRAVIGIFEQAGFAVRGAHQIAPDLLPVPGVPSTAQPSEQDRRDAARGAQIVTAMAAVDIGQACAVLRGQALAVEGVFGTDWMLTSLAMRPDAGAGQGGVMFKAPKSGQDRRIDLPMIGVATIDAAAAAGLSGVVIEAGGVMVLDLDDVRRACNRHNMFLWVREPQ
jgi:DUF1009 family protein